MPAFDIVFFATTYAVLAICALGTVGIAYDARVLTTGQTRYEEIQPLWTHGDIWSLPIKLGLIPLATGWYGRQFANTTLLILALCGTVVTVIFAFMWSPTATDTKSWDPYQRSNAKFTLWLESAIIVAVLFGIYGFARGVHPWFAVALAAGMWCTIYLSTNRIQKRIDPQWVHNDPYDTFNSAALWVGGLTLAFGAAWSIYHG